MKLATLSFHYKPGPLSEKVLSMGIPVLEKKKRDNPVPELLARNVPS